MLVQAAKDIARRWVREHAATIPGFAGAFFHGSVNWLTDDAPLPPTSDLDLMVVLEGSIPSPKLGKLIYHDVMLEVSYLALDQLQSAEQILGQSHLAGSFRGPSIIIDSTGRLTPLHAAVSAAYAQQRWVNRRCDHARDKVLQNLRSLDPTAHFHDQVMPWLFAAGVTTHILLVAGLQNPTVRRRYLATRDLLAAYDLSTFYPTLLELLGCATMPRATAEQHLAALSEAFDAAKQVLVTPFFFAADLTDQARPVAIDGSRELIERGDHREAIFWMVATYSRCQQVLFADAPPALQDRYTPGYRRLLADLGITSFADLQLRAAAIEAALPRIAEVAAAIIAANPEIEQAQV